MIQNHTLTPNKIILLPGMDGTGSLFAPLAKFLEQDLSVHIIAYPPDKQLSLAELANYVRAQVSFDEETILLAESFSGLVALELLKDKTLTMHSLILCASFASSPRPWLLQTILKLPIRKLLKLPIPTLLLRYFGLSRQADINEALNIQKAIAKVQPSILEQRLHIISNAQNTRVESRYSVPCQYLQANSDRLVPDHQASLFHEYFSDFTIRKIPQSGHFLLQVQPAICANIILNKT